MREEEIMGNSHTKRAVSIVAAMLLLIFGFVLGSSEMSAVASPAPTVIQQANPTQAPAPANDNEKTFSTIYNQVSPSVVSINVPVSIPHASHFHSPDPAFV